jgi:hypothetical protein
MHYVLKEKNAFTQQRERKREMKRGYDERNCNSASVGGPGVLASATTFLCREERERPGRAVAREYAVG